MINEVAIDPEVLLLWSKSSRDYNEFLHSYGIGTRRIVSSFPKQKFTKLRSYLISKTDTLNSELEKSRYTEMVLSLENNIFLRDNASGSSDDWYDLVADENVPFDKVLSQKEFDCKNLILLENLYDSNLYKLKNQISFNRTNESFINAVKNFINMTISKFVIIDAFAWKTDSIKVITQILEEISNRRNSSKLVEVIIIYKGDSQTNRDKAPFAKVYKNLILNELSRPLNSICIKVLHISESDNSDAFHNRYILNDLGGITLGHGLDISQKAGKGHTTDEVTLLEKDIYEKRWKQFVTQIEFDIVSSA